MDECVLELCAALHLNRVVQEFLAHNSSLEEYKKIPFTRLVCVTLHDIVINKRMSNYALAIDLITVLPDLCPQLEFDFRFGSLLIDIISQFVVYNLYTVPEQDVPDILFVIEEHFKCCPQWPNVADGGEISSLFASTRDNLKDLVQSKDKRNSYWRNCVLDDQKTKRIWDDMHSKLLAILELVESSLPPPKIARLMDSFSEQIGMPQARSDSRTESTSASATSKQQGLKESYTARNSLGSKTNTFPISQLLSSSPVAQLKQSNSQADQSQLDQVESKVPIKGTKKTVPTSSIPARKDVQMLDVAIVCDILPMKMPGSVQLPLPPPHPFMADDDQDTSCGTSEALEISPPTEKKSTHSKSTRLAEIVDALATKQQDNLGRCARASPKKARLGGKLCVMRAAVGYRSSKGSLRNNGKAPRRSIDTVLKSVKPVPQQLQVENTVSNESSAETDSDSESLTKELPTRKSTRLEKRRDLSSSPPHQKMLTSTAIFLTPQKDKEKSLVNVEANTAKEMQRGSKSDRMTTRLHKVANKWAAFESEIDEEPECEEPAKKVCRQQNVSPKTCMSISGTHWSAPKRRKLHRQAAPTYFGFTS